ncbi:hypothetical protein HPP92_019650 [Vanilla planifolia]|uniref:Uncharacterized protein n=1 Tax=Vanilla planifolia TaxID=51239 RepID=A0A835PZT3_VANPL|nr:hypothetical protein HPP92_019650 [Vanilla planifolia]
MISSRSTSSQEAPIRPALTCLLRTLLAGKCGDFGLVVLGTRILLALLPHSKWLASRRKDDEFRHSRFLLASSIRNQLILGCGLKGEPVSIDDEDNDEYHSEIHRVFLLELLKDCCKGVTPDDAEKDRWFVVKVIHFDKDAKERQDGVKPSRRTTRRLDKEACMKLVLSYLFEFDDDEEDGSLPQRNVPFYRVVALRMAIDSEHKLPSYFLLFLQR